MNQVINNYAIAVAEGNKINIAATFSTGVKAMPPAGNLHVEGIEKVATMLGAAAIVIDHFRLVRIFENEENWGVIIFEGEIDGNPVQLADQVYFDENSLINKVDIFFRPTAMAEILSGKMAGAIQIQASKG